MWQYNWKLISNITDQCTVCNFLISNLISMTIENHIINNCVRKHISVIKKQHYQTLTNTEFQATYLYGKLKLQKKVYHMLSVNIVHSVKN